LPFCAHGEFISAPSGKAFSSSRGSERLADGTFVAGWMIPHIAAVLEDRLQMLRELLEESKS
jgi:hypothetical protein